MNPERATGTIISLNGRSPSPVLSLIVPTKNEAGNIKELLAQIEQAMSKVPLEIIFVDDSTDNTPEVVSEAAQRTKLSVSLIHRPPEGRGDGLSGAVAEGMRVAQGDWVGVMDADLQHPPELLPSLLDAAECNQAQIVLASRYAHSGEAEGLGAVRSGLSKLCILAARIFFPRRLKYVSDPLSGYFLFRREAIDPDRLRPRGFKILLEILIRFPQLKVSEVPFRFLNRHSGQSKAALREGLRYLALLCDLRFKGLFQRLTRFGAVGTTGLAVNMLLLAALTDLGGLHYLVSAVLATLGSTLWNFALSEAWVFGDRSRGQLRLQRLGQYLLMNVSTLLVRGPFLVILTSGLGIHYLLSNFITLATLGLARYTLADSWIWRDGLSRGRKMLSGYRDGLSESWIWTEASPKLPQRSFDYDIHGIVRIVSDVGLPELEYFRSAQPVQCPDVTVRTGGTVSSNGTSPDIRSGKQKEFLYQEALGRLGFWVQIEPGDSTDIVAGHLLKLSPHVLYTNVVEPILRWTLVKKGCALVHAACLAIDGQAVLVTAPTDTGKTTTILRLLTNHSFVFLSDDMVILRPDGSLLCYPKPLTISRHTLEAIGAAPLSPWERLALQIQSRVHSKSGRRTALFLARTPLPMASVNAFVQMIVRPPKYAIERLIPDVAVVREATLSHLVAIELGPDLQVSLDPALAEQTLLRNCEDAYGFPPYSAMERFLIAWNGDNLRRAERDIISSALGGCPATLLRSQRRNWWEHLPMLLQGDNGAHEKSLSSHTETAHLKVL